MLYERIIPPESLSHLVDCYWVVENEDTAIEPQKIIPDGFPEIIFHYRDPYRINISGTWEAQSRKLLAGQIRNHFMLENTGASGMIGIKFKPDALTKLFDFPMNTITEKVVSLDDVLQKEFESVSGIMLTELPYSEKVELLNQFFESCLKEPDENDYLISKALELVFSENGLLSVTELAEKTVVNERKLERLFQKYIGLSPKFYSRIIRFNYIFRLVQDKKMSWSEVAQYSGFYDQSHFISNFREFTGEDPSKYFFEDDTLANFFLNRPIED